MIAIWMTKNQVTLFDDVELICHKVGREQAIEEITIRGYTEVFANNILDGGISAAVWKQLHNHLKIKLRDKKIAALEDELQRLREAS